MALSLLTPSTKTTAQLRINSLISAHNAKGVEVTPAGSIITDATVLNPEKFIHVVTGADGTKAVKLPSGSVGACYIIVNNHGTNALPVFPAADEKINGGTASAAFSHAALRAVVYTYVGGSVGWEVSIIIVALT